MSNGDFIPGPPQAPTQLPSPLTTWPPPPPHDDRHIRRGQEEYQWALSALLPQGIAWPRWPDTVLMKVVYGLAGILGFADGRAADLLERESDPRQTVELLPDWERNWGLPDCGLPLGTISERQKALVMKMTLLGAQSSEFFLSIASGLGYTASITEYRPFMVGIDKCGDNRLFDDQGVLGEWPCQIGDIDLRFAWTMHVQQPKLVWFRAGAGQAGIDPHLRIALYLDLECFVRRWAPAHTVPLFDYSQVGDPYAGTHQYYVVSRGQEPIVTRFNEQVTNYRPGPVLLFAPAYSLQNPQFAMPNAT